MTSINVGGRFLDLPEDLNLQFVKKNIYYSFDDIETERTLSFSVPKTPNNILAFNLAHLPQAYGEAMRTRVAAQLQIGVVVKNGYLYVDSYSQGVFDCIFITGELLGLKEIKELGDWSQFVSQDEGVALDAETMWASDSADNPAARILYRTDGDIKPSWLFPYYAQQAAQNANIDVDWGSVLDSIANQRIIACNPRGAKETSITLARIYAAEPSATTPYPTLNSVSGWIDGVINTRLSEYPIFIYDQEATQYYGYVQEFVALQDLTLKFGEETSDDVFLGSAQQNGTFAFLGDYSFALDAYGGYEVSGEPLAGRDVDIPAGTTFVLLTQMDLQLPASGYEGWKISAGTLEASVVVSGGEQSASAFARVCDNLPEMTMVDMLKVIAALSGTILNYKDGTISFVSDIVEGETVELRRAIKRSNLRRTFGDYAQRNIIAFESEELQPLRTVYTIDNVNIEQERTLQTIPMSEGSLAVYNGVQEAFVRSDYEGFVLLLGGSGQYMQRVTLPKNGKLQEVMSISASMELEVPMTGIDFDKLVQNRAFWFDGLTYLWTEAQWAKGIARLSLSSLGLSIAPPPPPPPPPYIPSDYQQVEYLQSYNKSTLTIPDDIDIYNATIEIKMDVSQYNLYRGDIIASLDVNYYRLYLYSGPSIYLTPSSMSVITSGRTSFDLLYTSSYPSRTLMTSIDGVIVSQNSKDTTVEQAPQSGYKIFGTPSGLRISYLKITTVAKSYELIPCYRKSDLVAGMYDRINDVFYTHINGFIVGEDVTT